MGRVGRLLGRLTGHVAAADSMASVFDTALASATVTPAGRQRPERAAARLGAAADDDRPGKLPRRAGRRAGGANLFEDVASSAGTVSIEAVAARDPDLILTTTAGPVAFASRPEWQAVRAVRERRFLPVTGSEFNRPSPRAPVGHPRARRGKLRRAG